MLGCELGRGGGLSQLAGLLPFFLFFCFSNILFSKISVIFPYELRVERFFFLNFSEIQGINLGSSGE